MQHGSEYIIQYDMVKINSKQKGKRGELAWSKLCREYGFDVIRTAQYCGKHPKGKADCIGLPGIHQEIKFVEHLNINDAMQQAINDAMSKSEFIMPIVAHKKSRSKWMVTMLAEDWLKLYKNWWNALVDTESMDKNKHGAF